MTDTTGGFSRHMRPARADAGTLPSRSFLQVNARGGLSADVMIYGAIGESLWGDSISARDLADQISGLTADTIRVRINSEGGVVPDGIAIYNALRAHPARKIGYVDGQAASIAGVILMACDEVVMYGTSLFMLHAPSTIAAGNSADFRSFAETLDTHARAMAEAYVAKTGKPAEVAALLADGRDHWFTGAEAVAFGFADRVESVAQTVAAESLRVVAMTSYLAAVDRAPGPVTACLRAHITASLSPSVFASLDEASQLAVIGQLKDPAMKQQYEQLRILATAGNTPAAAVQATAGTTAAATATEVGPAARAAIVAAERDRVATIRAMGAPHSHAIGSLTDTAISEGWSADQFGQQVLARLAEGVSPLAGTASVSTHHVGRPGGAEFRAAAADVLAQRAGVRIDTPHAAAADCAQMSLVEIARACLPREDRERHVSAHAVIRAALSTSDFPHILEDAMHRAVRRGYEDEPGTHSAWVYNSTVPDFRPQSRVLLGSMPELQLVPEGGEYKEGPVDEDKSVPFKVEKYGRIISITYEALVNDDLQALGRIPMGLGMSARRKEADLVYGLLEGDGQVMQDGNPLFHASHSNLAAPATTIDEASLSAGRLLLRKQMAFGGGQLNLTPRFLLVPPELESKAEKLLAASSVYVGSGIESSTAQWIRSLTLVVENRLPATAFYLATAPSQVDTVELAYLEEEVGFGNGGRVVHQQGARGPVVEHLDEFKRDVRAYKVKSTMGARVLDWRGLVKVPVSG